jgi:hypothetical protein
MLNSKTININNECWTVRFKEALKQIDSPYVLIMLEDFFIRSKVNQDKIDTCFFDSDTITFNFEKDYRDSIKGTNWNLQYNNQIYLNSCQAGIWDRLKLIDRLQEDMNAWQWECTNINSPFKHYINNGDTIIDYGYTHDRKGFGVTRGKWSKECMEFLKDDNIDNCDEALEILEDNYISIPLKYAKKGDIVSFHDEIIKVRRRNVLININHFGIIYKTDGTIQGTKIKSKWGRYGVFLTDFENLPEFYGKYIKIWRNKWR